MKKKEWASPENIMPGVKPDATVYKICEALANGEVLTALDGINRFRTMHMGKYISILRNDYRLPVESRWVELNSGKHCKEYYLL